MLYQLSYVGERNRTPPKNHCFAGHRDADPRHPHHVALERVVGIEPTSSAWKAEVLPLNYTRQLLHVTPMPVVHADPLVEGVGFEPTKA